MDTGRLEAFSDGVLAIIITIMVLGMEAPEGVHWVDLKPLIPRGISYLLSFIYVGIYWNNHHHLLQRTQRVNGKILWANLFLLFALSFLPFATGWMGKNHFEGNTVFLYGGVLLLSAIAWQILALQLVKPEENESVRKAFEKDRKMRYSIALYILGIILALVYPLVGLVFFYMVALFWIIPDVRLERIEKKTES